MQAGTGHWEMVLRVFLLDQNDQEASRSLSRWWSEVQAPTPPHTHSCACPWNGSLEGLSAPLPQSLLLPGPQGGTFSRLDLLFSSPVPPGPCFAPTAACMHASCSHHHHLHSVEAHVQTTHPCIILVRLHLYEKAFIFKWFFLLLVFF